MIHIPRSGFFLPSLAAGEFLRSLEPICGRNGVGAALRLSGLETWIEAYPGPDPDTPIDFAQVSSLLGALEQLYGPRSGRGLARKAGWATFDQLRPSFGLTGRIFRLGSKLMPLPAIPRLGLPLLSHMINQASDQVTSVQEHADSFSFTFHRCAICWGRKSENPACTVNAGVLERALQWGTRGHYFAIVETQCIAQGHDVCEFQIQKKPLS